MKTGASLIYNLCLLVGDFAALVLAFVGGYVLRVTVSHAPVQHPVQAITYFEIFLGLLVFWIIIFALLGLYDSNIYERRFSELGRLLIGSFIGLLFVVFWNFISVNPIFPAKLVPIYGFILGFIFLVIFRNLARYIRTKLFSYGVGLTHVALVGDTAMTGELLDSMDSPVSGYKVVAVIGGKRRVGEHKVPTFVTFKDFLESKPDLHGVIQTELYADESRNAEILTHAQENHIGYRFVPGNSELFVGNIDVELFRNSVPVINVRQTALFGWGRVVKRLSDLALGIGALIIASPFMLIIIMALKINEPKGDIFYRQIRLTRFDQKFTVFKFRTVKTKYNGLTPEEAFAKMGKPELAKTYRDNGDFLPDDPRFTTFARILRRASLDELPQLINVIRGDISFVGPRALIPQELSEFKKRHTILAVKSGLTGLAQVSGRRDINFDERRKLDLYYVQNWSIWLDITIIIKTMRIVLSRSGAK